MTRFTSTERAAIEAEIAILRTELDRLQLLLDSQPDGSDGDTIRMLQPLCTCGLPRDHRHPSTGEPRPCVDETVRMARIPGSVTGDETARGVRSCPGCGVLLVPDLDECTPCFLRRLAREKSGAES